MANYKDYGYLENTANHSHVYIAEPVLDLLDKRINKNILDVGCGDGTLVKYFVENGYNAYGTDASESGINIATKFSADRFALQDLSTDDLPAKFDHLGFDTITAIEVIEHLYDPRGLVKFCKDVLLKNGGGEIILTTPYHGYIKNLFLSIAGKWDQHADPLWDGGHIKLWSYKTISKLLVEYGFTVTKFKGCGRFPYLWKSMIIKAKI
jgi:2-polyprenyl-3-methyl-5-hydroxy-6-metoxy-1,4-benzoquinol methylase